MFVDKKKDKKLAEQIKEYNPTKLARGYDVESMEDKGFSFDMQLLAVKLLKKSRHNQVVTPIISLVSHCTQGVVYNWVMYLLNEFVEDCHEAQDQVHPFHYSWLLILIVMEEG